MKKILVTLITALALSFAAHAQELPQFTASNFEGWQYNNPGISLSTTDIARGNIVLYVTRQGLVLQLTSPLFSCQSLDSIEASLIWFTQYYYDSSFDLNKTALTMAIDDETGAALDSVTYLPEAAGSTHYPVIRLAVPQGLNTARVRFVSWKADVVSCGAIKRALLTGIAATPHDDPQPGDIDSNGVVNISDATMLIQALMLEQQVPNADFDGNGIINITDATLLIDYVLKN